MDKNDTILIQKSLLKIDTRLDKIDVTLAKQSKDIEHHIKRTDILEKTVTPIYKSHQQILGVMKFLGFVALLLSVARGLTKFLH